MSTDDFQPKETVVCWRNVRNPDTGEYVDPSTSMQINIYDPHNGAEVEDADMTKDATGKYHYDYLVPNPEPTTGTYWAKYVATDGTRVTIWWDSFEVSTK